MNVAPDLAEAMKTNPRLKVMVNGGYYDLATPFFAAQYEEKHLPIPQSLAKNIEYDWYESGHMVYVRDEIAEAASRPRGRVYQEHTGGQPVAAWIKVQLGFAVSHPSTMKPWMVGAPSVLPCD